MQTQSEYTAWIKSKVLQSGFDDCGISKAEALEDHGNELKKWLKAGMHADMDWMERNIEKRIDPQKLVPGAKSVITVLLNYYTEKKQVSGAPVISKYTFGKDYHKVIKRKLKNVLRDIKKEFPEVSGRYFVDSAPVLEHAWAVKSGLGWIGKNSLLISKKLGSYVFIGEIILNLELDYDKPMVKEFCGSCQLCIHECPTHAILPDRKVDSNKCISYHTIENKTSLPENLKDNFFHRLVGCDICQDVCPWNHHLESHNTDELNPSSLVLQYTQNEWGTLSEEEFNKIFESSAVKRVGFHQFRRNLKFLKYL